MIDREEQNVIRLVLITAAILAIVFGIVGFLDAAEPSREVVILYFTQPNCSVCTQQKPNWLAFKKTHPTFQTVEIDTSKQGAATKLWNVTTTPTTIFIRADDKGQSIESSRVKGVLTAAGIGKRWSAAMAPEIARIGRNIEGETAKRDFSPAP